MYIIRRVYDILIKVALKYINSVILISQGTGISTINFYDEESTQLTKRYDNADMSQLHEVISKHIPLKSELLDIGFGSGRDLQYLRDQGHEVWGIDPSIKFVEYAKKRFPEIKNQFMQASLPFEKKLFGEIDFDAIISIAVWMHLYRKEYKDAVESIINVSRPNSVVIISYSIGSREQQDERYFETVDLDHLSELFSNGGFKVIDTIQNQDSLQRDSLTWVTVVFKRD